MTSSSRSTLSHSRTNASHKTDRLLTLVTRASTIVSSIIVLLVVAFLMLESVPAFEKIGLRRFFTDDNWYPLSGQFNLVPMIVATVLTSAGAVVVATPLGIASAIFCEFYAPKWIGAWYKRAFQLLAGIPSVVFGLWGLIVLAPIVARLGGSGQGLLTATLVLALMILPTIALTSRAALAAVPREFINGGAALGLQRWSIAWRISVPAAQSAIGVGVLLALSRALGETMAVLMLAGNVVQLPASVLSPVRTMTANIALEMGYATSGHRATLFASALLLMAVVVGIVLLSRFVGGKRHAI